MISSYFVTLGDIAFRFLDYIKEKKSRCSEPILDSEEKQEHVVCCDINASMLKVGQARSEKLGYSPTQISWKEGDAMNLPFDDGSFDAYTIAYGIRNVVRIDEVMTYSISVQIYYFLWFCE